MKRIAVDGEHFDVTERVSEPSVYELRWVSGPNADYGFATSTCGGEGQTDVELADAIRNCPSQVDPTSGYIE
ncbi:hypothetical protein ASD62_03745 [Phycicoccus sp. Root563]|uniref:hypothetical protein n=1 Tax=Phycicoccus sp. Root563 TaxID=1736562 RepID=UPI0007028A8A|nr:hypothetical protein [Phycicoccus sp. Root563]KQZ88555.1 hypothetical protein ASD62_03745 [Phycicoccus sp. Root563]